jgi:hypothetical protein
VADRPHFLGLSSNPNTSRFAGTRAGFVVRDQRPGSSLFVGLASVSCFETAARRVLVVETADANSPRDCEPTTDLLAIVVADLFHRRRIRAKAIGDDAPRSAIFLHDTLEKLQRSSLSRFAVTTASKNSPS